MSQLKWDITDTGPDLQTDMPGASSSAQPNQVFGPASTFTILYFLFYFLGVVITSLLVFCSIKLFLCFFNFVCKKERSLLKHIYKKGKIAVSHLLKSVLKYLFIFRSDIIHI